MSTVEDFKKKLDGMRKEEAMITTEVGRIPISKWIRDYRHLVDLDTANILYFVNLLENSSPITETSATVDFKVRNMSVRENVLYPVVVGYGYTTETETDNGLRLTVNSEEMHYVNEGCWLMLNSNRNIAAFAQRKYVSRIALKISTWVMGVNIGLKYLEFEKNKLVKVVYLEEGTWKPVMIMCYDYDGSIVSIGGFERKIIQSTEMGVPLLYQPGITIDVSTDQYDSLHPQLVTADYPGGLDKLLKEFGDIMTYAGAKNTDGSSKAGE